MFEMLLTEKYCLKEIAGVDGAMMLGNLKIFVVDLLLKGDTTIADSIEVIPAADIVVDETVGK